MGFLFITLIPGFIFFFTEVRKILTDFDGRVEVLIAGKKTLNEFK